MLENDLAKTLQRPLEFDLDNLESDIWRAVDEKAEEVRIAALLAPWQFVVIAMALAGSAASGNFILRNLPDDSPSLTVFSADTPLAPSTILLGPSS